MIVDPPLSEVIHDKGDFFGFLSTDQNGIAQVFTRRGAVHRNLVLGMDVECRGGQLVVRAGPSGKGGLPGKHM